MYFADQRLHTAMNVRTLSSIGRAPSIAGAEAEAAAAAVDAAAATAADPAPNDGAAEGAMETSFPAINASSIIKAQSAWRLCAYHTIVVATTISTIENARSSTM
jgi:hypothetical protein